MQTLISELVGAAYPPVKAVDDGRFRRTWIARTDASLPSTGELATLQQLVEDYAFRSIKEAYSAIASAAAIIAASPTIQLVRLDDHHVIVCTEFAGPERTVGDAAMISQWGVLQQLDRHLRFDELQGIPCEHWWPLRAAREAGSVEPNLG